jgi:signal peptidase I
MNLEKLPYRKLRHIAEELLRTGIKVYRYRQDQLAPEMTKELNGDLRDLDLQRKNKDSQNRPRLQDAISKVDTTLRKTGGTFYPNRGWSENIEMLLVGAFLVIGIRTFFFQPFIIPTNSMFPTYNGMTYENYVVLGDEADKLDAPAKPVRILRKLLVGATHVEVIAKNQGKLQVSNPRRVTGKKWFIFPSEKLEFTIHVGSEPHKFQVPLDFHAINEILIESHLVPNSWSQKPRTVQAGEKILSFDILSGDALFVDRMSYHFRKPRVGDPFVFKTNLVKSDDISVFSDLANQDPGKYYIKRLVGKGGDNLQIDPPVLIRNGAPITGVKAFEKNAARVDNYSGYTINQDPRGRFFRKDGDIVEIPTGHFFAMGDNSPNSSDSRTWGFVPKDAVIGRAVFIYYPFTKRWGLSK